MKFLKNIFTTSLSMALLAALGFGGYFAVTWIAGALSRLDVKPDPAAVVLLSLLLAALIVASSIRRVSRQNKVCALQSNRAAAYQFFMGIWETLLRPEGLSVEPGADKLARERQALNHLLTLYGSPKVIQAHLALQALEREGKAQYPEAWALFAGALLEIRKDLGAEVKGLTSEVLLQLFFAGSAGADAGISAQTSASGDAQLPQEIERIPASAYSDLRPRVSLKTPG